MGNTMSATVGWVIVFYLSTIDKFRDIFLKHNKNKDYYNHEIILKDEENQAGTQNIYNRLTLK